MKGEDFNGYTMSRRNSLLFIAIFSVLFIATSFHGDVKPSISEIRVVEYGFPVPWLSVTTSLVRNAFCIFAFCIPETHFSVIWSGLIINVFLYGIVALALTLILYQRSTSKRKTVPVTIKTINCKYCGSPNPVNNVFCEVCGKSLHNRVI